MGKIPLLIFNLMVPILRIYFTIII